MDSKIEEWEKRLEDYKKMYAKAKQEFKNAEVPSVQQKWKQDASKYNIAIFLCSQVLIDFRE